jgi:hypothetical protein
MKRLVSFFTPVLIAVFGVFWLFTAVVLLWNLVIVTYQHSRVDFHAPSYCAQGFAAGHSTASPA